jgi:hypothetical protein
MTTILQLLVAAVLMGTFGYIVYSTIQSSKPKKVITNKYN